MSGSDEIAEEARRLVKERAFTPVRFLTALERGGYTATDLSSLPAAQRETLLPALRAMLRERIGQVRLNVALALLELGDPSGSEPLVECLAGHDRDLRGAALDRLMTWLPHDREKGGYKASIDADAVLAALEPSLADADRQRREQAVYILKRLETPQAFDRLTELLGDARPDVRAEAAIWLGRCGHDRGALLVIEEMLAVPAYPKRYHLVAAVEKVCKSADADLSSRAAAVARRFIRRNLASRGASLAATMSANDIWHCLNGLAAAGVPDEQDILREVLASKVDRFARGIALKRLAQLEGRNGVARLVDALSDPELRRDALEGLRSPAGGSHDAAVLDILAREIAREDPESVSALIKTFLAFGGQVKDLPEEIAARVDSETAMTVHWVQSGIGPREAAAKLQPACGDVALNEETIQKLEVDWREKRDAEHIVYAILGGPWKRLTGFDCEDVESPADHTQIVRYLAAITGDQFAVDDIVQIVEPNGDLRLLLTHQDSGYSFTMQNHGSWCNLPGTLDGLNRILERLGLAERFIELYTGGAGPGVVAFVRPDKFLPVAHELRIQ